MMLEWMLYSILAAAGFSVAALIAERVLLRGRSPVRVVWASAMVVSIVVPLLALAVAIVSAASPAPAVISPIVSADLSDAPATRLYAAGATELLPTPSVFATAFSRWREAAAALDGDLTLAWIALSLVAFLNFAGGAFALARLRSQWRMATVLNVPVLVSAHVGPAVVGIRAPAIVIPEWVLDLGDAQLALLLQHEEEHRLAHDGVLLGVARVLLLLMPWNVALYWQVRRLRVAVELDCDARVLQGANACEYGDLLLRVARAGHGKRLMGATAFAERATQLERRIRVLGRHRRVSGTTAVTLACCVGVLALSAAWIAPHPAAPRKPSSTVLPSSPSASQSDRHPDKKVDSLSDLQPRRTTVQRNDTLKRDTTTRDTTVRVRVDSATTVFAKRKVRGDTLVALARSVVFDGQIVRGDTVLNVSGAALIRAPDIPIDSVASRLLAGMNASSDQETRVRQIFQRLRDLQRWMADSEEEIRRFRDVLLKRDSAFRALLTNDNDRARFDTLVAQRASRGAGARIGGAGPGARGGGAANDSSVAIPRSPDGAGGRGRSGGAGGVDALIQRVFDGISLTAAQQAEARDIVQRTQARVRDAQPRGSDAPVFGIDVMTGRVAMSAAYANSIEQIFSKESQRATLRSRLAVLPP